MSDTKNNIDKPSHYTTGEIECIDAIKSSMSKQEFVGFLKANAIKYLWRYDKKSKPSEDLKKSVWFINRLIQEIEHE
jgi:hypothetical protein